MKLWLISQGENKGYDTYDSAVVAAETEQEARETHPAQWGDPTYKNGTWWIKRADGAEFKDNSSVWASNADLVDAEYIGEAKEGIEAGAIITSFNAG